MTGGKYIVIFAMLASGCQTTPTPGTVDITPLSSQLGNLSQANADLRAANERLMQGNAALSNENERLKAQLRADADAGLVANAQGWLPFEGYVWRQQIARLPGINPDTDTATKWTEAAGLYVAGGASAMQGVINSLHSDAAEQAEKLGELSSRIEQLTNDRDAAQEVAAQAHAAVRAAEGALTDAVARARQDEARKIRDAQVQAANRGGVVCGTLSLALIAAAMFSPAAKSHLARGAVLAAALAISLFAAARWLGSPWFGWSVAGAWGVCGMAWIAWRIRSGLRTEPMAVAAPILIEELDKLYEHPDNVAWMDANLFPALQARGAEYDAAVKRIKADGLANRQ
jgi:outer membrane murein-binding lipoprotein Lpp